MAEASMKQRFENIKFKRRFNRFLRMKNIEITEKDLQGQIEQLLQLFKWRYYHTWNSRHSVKGFPDVIALRPDTSIAFGRRLVAELKREKEDPTADQQDWLNAFKQAGFEVYVWRPADFEKIVEILR